MVTCYIYIIFELYIDMENFEFKKVGQNLVVESFDFQIEEFGFYFLEFYGLFGQKQEF